MTYSTHDLRCVSCGESNLSCPDSAALRCANCGISYPKVWGVPFIGDYESHEILGLIEIAANTENRGKFGVTPEVVNDWEKLLGAYHDAPDKDAFVASYPGAQSPFLLNRYGEWVEVTSLIRGIDLQGKDVLDVGAGLGFDSQRLAMRGAKVTALEFSPLLAEAGHLSFPHIRWIGGFSHILPFNSCSFDAVFCNAALHHMRDIPAAISEALRVLRPGGYLVTTCDSFCSVSSKDDEELAIFDTQPAVLLGVNERIPRFSEFIAALQLHPELVEIDLFTHTLYNAPSGGTLTQLTRWDFARDKAMLAKRSGSLAMRVRLKALWPEPGRLQRAPVLAPATYAEWLTSESSAVAYLASLMPEGCLDLPFPGGRGSKFELLNGWRLQLPNQHARTAYRRGRWFLRRPANADTLLFEIGLPASDEASDVRVEILLNGSVVEEVLFAGRVWTRVKADIDHIPPGQTFTIEIRKLDGDKSLSGAAFVVRDRRFIVARGIDASRNGWTGMRLEAPKVFAVIPVFNRRHFTLACIEHLKAQTYPELQIIVSDGGSSDGTVEAVRAAFPDVTVLTTETELWWAGSMEAGIQYALRESTNDDDCLLMMNNDTQIDPDFVEKMVSASQCFDSAVGSLIVDSRNTSHVLDAGEYVVWSPYSFPVKTNPDPAERFCDDVDVLPGRGSLVPLRMIRQAGSVDARRFPHYLADYEFFYRLKRAGFRLGVCYEARLMAHIEETGIIPCTGVCGFSVVWRELFSRRSLSNVVDHWRFVSRHAPPNLRFGIRCRLVGRTFFHLGLRTPLRPLGLTLLWCALAPVKLIQAMQGQARTFRRFAIEVRKQGLDALCHPQLMPGIIRPLLYLIASPGPVKRADILRAHLSPDVLVKKGVLRRLNKQGWYAFSTLKTAVDSERAILAASLKPWFKIWRTIGYFGS